MRGTPKKGRRFGGSSAHQKAMMGNLVASLIAAEFVVTTEAKAKALRPVAEKCITAAAKGGIANQRRVVALIRDRTWRANYLLKLVRVTQSDLVATHES